MMKRIADVLLCMVTAGWILTAGWYAVDYAMAANRAGVPQSQTFAASLTPAATSAEIQTAEQTFTVTGLGAGWYVVVNGPAPTSLCPMVAARVSAANTIAISFSTLTAAACTPKAGTYNIMALH